MPDDQREFRRVHFIGVAGSGMAGIAYVAHQRGIRVSGSDLRPSSYLQPLLSAGVPLAFEHNAANVADPDIELVVTSTAIPDTNPELITAVERGIEVWPRARMLAYLGRGKRILAVSGTHGKTTTSSLLATALIELGADPSFLIGGVPNAFTGSAHYSAGEYMVMEADESDASFTWLSPYLAIVTNIEADHMDHFESLEQIKRSFLAFLNKLDPQGLAVVCADSAGLVPLVEQSGKPFITYGQDAKASVRLLLPANAGASANAGPRVQFAGGATFALPCQNQLPQKPQAATAAEPVLAAQGLVGEKNCSTQPSAADPAAASFATSAPGVHNLLNATAVLAALDWLGFDRAASLRACATFAGVHRRFERIGQAGGVLVVDDYGHHPTEVSATLAAAQSLGFTQVHLLFQPHRFTRTQAFLQEFGAAFDFADSITLMDIYTAGESPILGIDSQALLKAIKAHNAGARVRLISRRSEVAAAMAELAEPGSLVITMGAGDVTELAPAILEALRQRQEPT